MRLSGWVWVVLGILMSLYARFIQSKVQKPSLGLFFWVGLGFVVIGIFKLVLGFVFKDKSNVALGTVSQSSNSKHAVAEAERRKLESGLDKKEEIVACSRCGTRHFSASNFCHMCGNSLK